MDRIKNHNYDIKVLLLWPPIKDFLTTLGGVGLGGYNAIYTFPYGLGVLKARLEKNGFNNIKIEDIFTKIAHSFDHELAVKTIYRLNKSFKTKELTDHLINGIYNIDISAIGKSIIKYIEIEPYDVIGISAQSFSEYVMALIIAKTIKEIYPEKVLVMGGPFIKLSGRLNFQFLTFVDFMVVGNGELPFLALIKYLAGIDNIRLEEIPGLIFRYGEKTIENSEIKFDINEEMLPSYGLDTTYYKKKILGEMKVEIPYRFSQGCSNRCSFCTYPNIDKLQS